MSFFSKCGVKFDPASDTPPPPPTLDGKVILVTGGNVGLGKESIFQLARHNPAAIWLAARSRAKGEDARAEIQREVPNAPIHLLDLDLGSFRSVIQAARTMLESTDRLDILMLNAGIMAHPAGVTAEGYEVQFGTNHMGHALLTKLLLPLLLRTSAAPDADVRVNCLSSMGHNWASPEGIRFDSLCSTAEGMNTWTRYGQSKLANILFARVLAQQYPQLTVVAVHPESVQTNLNTVVTETALPRVSGVVSKITSLWLKTVQDGAKNQLWASTSREVKTGEYYEPVGVLNKASARALNAELAMELWKWPEKELEPITV
ncbi:NAD(P)-binding protein [Aspergillus sclerotiicarbonarius CBS 121057]|uniref:NAD(P)-binding protein n=1 Tax=Aspergillus sclerotiicarbonarius (strain CBS 121057 / IBT 28362) TaxID=1448318 RepID=A0A319E4U9_ASPSB|nr:NAD(P)-binding protein [Aspergillus sclerotiicarbonarius CBS 121057]